MNYPKAWVDYWKPQLNALGYDVFAASHVSAPPNPTNPEKPYCVFYVRETMTGKHCTLYITDDSLEFSHNPIVYLICEIYRTYKQDKRRGQDDE